MSKEDRSYKKYQDFPYKYGIRTIIVEERDTSYASHKTPHYPARLSENSMKIHDARHYWYPVPVKNVHGEVTNWRLPVSPPLPVWGEIPPGMVHKLLNRIQSRTQQGQVNLGAAYGEREESIKMIGQRVDQATDLLISHKANMQRIEKAIKKAQAPKKIKRLIKLASDLRLEFSYGWSPLASDLYTLCNEIMPPIFYSDVSATVMWSNPQPKEGSVYGYTIRTSGTFRAKAKVGLEQSSPLISSGAMLGLTNPAEVAWELVPWSFAVDWILPVGDYLRQSAMFHGLKVRFSSMTITQEGKSSATYNLQPPYPSSQSEFKHYVRQSLPSPSLPRFANSPIGGTARSLNQLALLGQLIGKTSKK